ncbi:flagellar biosynthesis anti-sigma factor FlgM [Providencia sneebia]|uniref:Anti-sigma28 factor FlgM n=1 Tax=Providencia sneebia DSM 19967 TaxID=1141660 RepID=K8WDA8_9GAMM|nr:flagellar biosynthesis anti-sigma factor FlgM [Providencia sneebia]EKT58554.1 anti-sigma28 factor FlgM [Providencia sneebia DSM 19967]
MTIKQTLIIPMPTKQAKCEKQETAISLSNQEISATQNPKEILFSLSEVHKKLLQPQPSDINMDKIIQLKKAIQCNTLHIESTKIAKNIVVSSHEYIQLIHKK